MENGLFAARMYAELSRKEIEKRYEIPEELLEAYETGKIKCPPYLENLLVDRILSSTHTAYIKWEDEFKTYDKDEPKRGYSCWLGNHKNDKAKYEWFIPVDDNEMMSSQVMWKIKELTDKKWRIIFL